MSLSNTIQVRDRLNARLAQLLVDYEAATASITSSRRQGRASRLAREIDKTEVAIARLERLAEAQTMEER